MTFKDIIGQEKAVNYLLKIVKEKKISSSYIFMGNEGVGKKFIAKEFAKMINCLKLKSNLETCENCLACKKINKQCCPDLKIIEPIKNSIRIDQIRELRREITLKPFENRKKIYIIDKAEEMTIDAENCLLKTIEEPPNYAIIILICSNMDSILPTIISRCQLLYFKTLSSLEIEKYILEKHNLEKNKAKLVSKVSQGSIGRAFKILSDDNYFIRRDKLLNYMASILPGKFDVNIFEEEEKTFLELNRSKEMIEMILLWYRDILIYKSLEDKKYIINYDKLILIEEKANKYSYDRLVEIIDYLLQIEEYIKKNANKKIIFENLFIKLAGAEEWLK
ncbi:MAG: DNA polymerase III subunit delta' C-terminal domain-containing protein [Candidatus Caldatribacteriota bacterium]|nr:DNA polymerase III subunit delta' C-terminal domain-containing protein [Candidatus Caldatribacteriota bacterium]